MVIVFIKTTNFTYYNSFVLRIVDFSFIVGVVEFFLMLSTRLDFKIDRRLYKLMLSSDLNKSISIEGL